MRVRHSFRACPFVVFRYACVVLSRTEVCEESVFRWVFSMSDCDSEDYSSSADEDYVPSGGEYSEDDVNELVKESDEEEEGSKKLPKDETKKKKGKSISARKRKKGVLVLNSEEKLEADKGGAHSSEEEQTDGFSEVKTIKDEEAKKKKEDDLWSSFLSDVGEKPKIQSPTTAPTSIQTSTEKPKESNKSAAHDAETSKQKEDTKVTITKVFDFAGEEVKVTKEVDVSSKEAKEFLKQQENVVQQAPNPMPSRVTALTGSGVKRPGGMSSILGKLGSKKQKMSTLEKSKLDWDTFKEQEGISEELAIHNRGKNGYIERKAFLERVDYRLFEQERDIRLKNMKP
ncbi:craniofacial development protein 1 [Spea bombifrons]|uniref:craniofacial development protein 1 n=1 Tax=Spea bombifrons TaxID=233779 RepID=UPI00234A61A1|nr:craniofacial development protein 1 [Spea bombifrons]